MFLLTVFNCRKQQRYLLLFLPVSQIVFANEYGLCPEAEVWGGDKGHLGCSILACCTSVVACLLTYKETTFIPAEG